MCFFMRLEEKVAPTLHHTFKMQPLMRKPKTKKSARSGERAFGFVFRDRHSKAAYYTLTLDSFSAPNFEISELSESTEA